MSQHSSHSWCENAPLPQQSGGEASVDKFSVVVQYMNSHELDEGLQGRKQLVYLCSAHFETSCSDRLRSVQLLTGNKG